MNKTNSQQPHNEIIPPVTIGGFEVVGGIPTTYQEFPDCCAVGDLATPTRYYCSGTLIAPTVVVTAQHCYNPECGNLTSSVFLNGVDIAQPGAGETIEVAYQIMHPEMDFRVLVLDRPSTVKPRKIASLGQALRAKVGLVVGFGCINLNGTIGYGIQRKVEVPIIAHDGGTARVQKKYGSQKGEMVAGHSGLLRDSCRGDSGGPLYVRDVTAPNEYLLVGATKCGTRDAKNVCGDGGIYTRVDLIKEWIEGVTGLRFGS